MYEIIKLAASELQWSFSRNDSHPVYRTPNADGSYPGTIAVDPFPCYSHDEDLVRAELDKVAASFPLEHGVRLFILEHETDSRTNGWAERKTTYDREAGVHRPAQGHIILSGKRIPPHPAVTRYLVAHEYGHHAEYEIARRRGLAEHDDFDDEYAEMRGCSDRISSSYGGGTWHATTAELIANDFRILVAEAEVDFWPHPGFEHPHDLPQLKNWWTEQLA